MPGRTEQQRGGRRWWQAAALGAAVGLSATGCARGEPSPPPASAAPSASPDASAAAVGPAFQAALDRLVIDRALARTDRAEAAADFNAEGSDRAAAMTAVKAACARLVQVLTDFDEAMRALTFVEPVKTDADVVFGATGTLLGVLVRYAEATTPDQFAEINRDEQVANAVWEQTIAALAVALGTRGLGTGPSPAPTSDAGATATSGPEGTAGPTATPDGGPDAGPDPSPTP